MAIHLPKLLPLAATARRLRVPARWLRSEAEAGRVPHLRAADEIMFDPEAVEAVLLERARELPSEVGKGADR